MKRIKATGLTLLSLLFFMTVLLSAPVAHAVDILGPVCNNAGGQKPAVCTDNNTGPNNPLLGDGSLLSTITNILAILGGISAVAVIIVSGLRIILSNGDSNSFASARKQIIYAIVGLAVIFAASAIINLVLSRIE
jgi:type IV secretory pathway VirB2 component (pilin)